MSRYNEVKDEVLINSKVWLIAGFIGSNLLEHLLKLNQTVIGLDNFETGHQRNLDEVKSLVTSKQWQGFTFIKGDIRNYHDCEAAMVGVDYVLHQTALGSVPRSIADPLKTKTQPISQAL